MPVQQPFDIRQLEAKVDREFADTRGSLPWGTRAYAVTALVR